MNAALRETWLHKEPGLLESMGPQTTFELLVQPEAAEHADISPMVDLAFTDAAGRRWQLSSGVLSEVRPARRRWLPWRRK